MKLRKIVEVILAAVMLAGCGGTSKKENVITHFKQEKARTVITTDGEVDDRNGYHDNPQENAGFTGDP